MWVKVSNTMKICQNKFKKMKKLALFFILLVSQSWIYAQNCDRAIIDDALNDYKTGDFKRVLKELESCTNFSADNNLRIQAFKLIVKTHLALDDDTSAVQAMKRIMQIDPKFQPDLLSDNLLFITLFEKLKRENVTQIVTSVSKKEENLNEAPATVSLITEKQILERGYLDLEAVLHDLPGFDISRSNGNLYTHAYQRGYRSINTNRTLFLFDGVEDNDLWSSNVYLSRQYALTNVKNIEVVYGPASTMYGSNAFLGVINVITKNPEDFIETGKNFGIKAQLTYGSYNTRMLDMSFAIRSKKNSVSFSITPRIFLSNEQNLSDYSWHDYEPNVLTDELSSLYHSKLDITNSEKVTSFLEKYPENSDLYSYIDGKIILTETGISQALEYDNDVLNKVEFSDKTQAYSIEAKLKIYDFLLGYMYWNKAEGPGAQYNDLIEMTFEQGQAWRPIHNNFYVKYNKSLSEKLDISNFLNFKVHDFDKNNNVVRYRKNYSSGHFDLTKLIDGKIPTWDSMYLFQISNQMRNEFKVIYTPHKRVDLISGFEIRYSSIQGDYTMSTKNNAQEEGNPLTEIPGGNHIFSRDLGFYSQAKVGLLYNLNLTVGIRYDNNKIRENQGYKHAVNPRFVLVYSPNNFIFKLIYAEAFKDATNREKYSTAAGKRELSNPNLAPEKVKNYEISIAHTFYKKLFLNISAYHSLYSNIIQEVRVEKADGTFTNQNQSKGEARGDGINAMADYQINKLSLYANYTLTAPFLINPTDSEGNILTNDAGEPYNKLRISDISTHQANLGANYLWQEKWNFNLRMNFRSKRITGENTSVPQNLDTFGSYIIFNGAITYNPQNFYGFSFQLTFFNLLNKEYFSPGLDQVQGELASSLKQNGRNLYLTIKYEF